MEGLILAVTGAVLAVFGGAIGSSFATGITGLSASGLVAREPDKFGGALLLQAIPSSQGILGFLGAFLIINKLNLLNPATRVIHLDPNTGWLLFLACLPVAVTGLISGIYQGMVCSAGIDILAKAGSQHVGKGILFAAIVETFAVFGLIATFLLIQGIYIPPGSTMPSATTSLMMLNVLA